MLEILIVAAIAITPTLIALWLTADEEDGDHCGHPTLIDHEDREAYRQWLQGLSGADDRATEERLRHDKEMKAIEEEGHSELTDRNELNR